MVFFCHPLHCLRIIFFPPLLFFLSSFFFSFFLFFFLRWLSDSFIGSGLIGVITLYLAGSLLSQLSVCLLLDDSLLSIIIPAFPRYHREEFVIFYDFIPSLLNSLHVLRATPLMNRPINLGTFQKTDFQGSSVISLCTRTNAWRYNIDIHVHYTFQLINLPLANSKIGRLSITFFLLFFRKCSRFLMRKYGGGAIISG